MSGSYVYDASSSGDSVYYGTIPGWQQPIPFVPEGNFIYNPSPFTTDFSLPPLSPGGAYVQGGSRRTSWNGPYAVNDNTSYSQPQTPRTPRPLSLGGLPGTQWPYASAMGNYIYIHRWLNAYNPAGDFLFDLSVPTPSPKHYIAPNKSVEVSSADLTASATNPSVTHLHISCDLTRKWSVEIRNSTGITIKDVLDGIHKHLQMNITATDWNSLTLDKQTAVYKAYIKRCRNAGNAEEMFKKQGVKWVDFLCDKVLLRGLVLDGMSGDRMKMIVSGYA